jgi:ribonucleoside-diphosphate reductase beta chain
MSIFTERKNYKPFEYSGITDPLINAMWAGHWTHNEFNFLNDIQDYRTKLTVDEQGVIKRAILLTSQVEVAVKSYWSNIGKLLPKPEIADMGAVFGGIEVIHAKAYAEILSKLGLEEEFNDLFNEPIIVGRVNYLTKYINKIYKNDHKNICYSLVLFTLFTEYTALFSQFYTILGFNRFRGVLKDVANVVQYTSKEENLHAEGGIALLNQIRAEHPELFDSEFIEKIRQEVLEAYKAESDLIDWILDGYENNFLSARILKGYVQIRLNDSLQKIGMETTFDIDPKLREETLWMEEEVYASALTDFFHKKPTEYSKKMKTYNEEDLF